MPPPQSQPWWYSLWEEYTAFLRLEQRAEQALAELDQGLLQKQGRVREGCAPLLLDRFSVLAALERWDDAEKSVEDFFRLVEAGDFPARFWTRACLMRGYLRERRGDAAGAMAAWQLGLPHSHPSLGWSLDRTAPIALAHQLILCALCDELSDTQVEALETRLFDQMGAVMQGTGVKATLQVFLPELTPHHAGPVLRGMWQTEEGRRLAHQIAFRELSLPELHQRVLVFGMVALVQHHVLPHRLTEDEETLLRKLGNDFYRTAATGNLRKKHMLAFTQLGFCWRNQPSFLGWDVPARMFEPHLRGPMAYFVGLRHHEVFHNTKQATTYFEKALQGAAPGSELQRLASVA